MVEDAGFASGEAKGLRVADEVNFVAEGGEFDAEFGGDYATAAVSGVTRNSDTHRSLDWTLVVDGKTLVKLNWVQDGVVQSESHHHNTSEHETVARPSGILHEHEKHASHAKKHQKYPQEGHKTSKHKSHKRGERPE